MLSCIKKEKQADTLLPPIFLNFPPCAFCTFSSMNLLAPFYFPQAIPVVSHMPEHRIHFLL